MGVIRKWLNHPLAALALVAIVAGGLRFHNLGTPTRYVFDEVYYAKDACLYAGHPFRDCGLDSKAEQSWVHPPLGKWTIAAGVEIFGNDPFGWRVAAAAFGTASVVITASLALLLFRSAAWAMVAGLLLATESLHFVQSRISMLDIFLAFWVILGFTLLVLDRRWIDRRTFPGAGPRSPGGPGAAAEPAASLGPGAMATAEAVALAFRPVRPLPSPILRPWRLAAGVAFGAAVASKWSGVIALFGAILLAFTWERTRGKAAGSPRPLWRAVQQESLGILLALVFVPIAVYLASYAAYFADNGLSPTGFWRQQSAMASYHLSLNTVNPVTGDPIHPYMSRPWGWLLLWRPTAYYFENPGTEILGTGNPAVFWASLLTIPYLVLVWWRRRDWRAGFVLVAILSQYLPWFLSTRPMFLFYMTPATPFLVLAATFLLRDLSAVRPAGARTRAFLPVAAGYVAVAVGMFAFFWPILVAHPLSRSAWQARMWFRGWI